MTEVSPFMDDNNKYPFLNLNVSLLKITSLLQWNVYFVRVFQIQIDGEKGE